MKVKIVIVALGIVCIVLAVGLVGAILSRDFSERWKNDGEKSLERFRMATYILGMYFALVIYYWSYTIMHSFMLSRVPSTAPLRYPYHRAVA